MIFKVPCCQKENSKFDKQQDRLNQVGKEAESRFALGRGGKHDYHMQLQMTKGSSVKLEVLMRMIVIGGLRSQELRIQKDMEHSWTTRWNMHIRYISIISS